MSDGLIVRMGQSRPRLPIELFAHPLHCFAKVLATRLIRHCHKTRIERGIGPILIEVGFSAIQLPVCHFTNGPVHIAVSQLS